MNTPQKDQKEPWTDGSSISAAELSLWYEIPREEVTAFHPYVRIYPNGATLIQEGETDKSLYLVRTGKVGVYKKVGVHQEQIATIEAVNFVGEMSLINNEPRSATIRVLTEQALVYALTRPNLNLIYSSPKWSELLISRLCKNLAEKNTQFVAASGQMDEFKAEIHLKNQIIERMTQASRRVISQAELAFDAILYMQKMTAEKAMVGTKGWAYLRMLSDLSRALVAHYLPEAHVSEEAADLKTIKKSLDGLNRKDLGSIIDELGHSLK
jgi:CRP/FNR family transcriptional regulator, cyclic AMP receptor protein